MIRHTSRDILLCIHFNIHPMGTPTFRVHVEGKGGHLGFSPEKEPTNATDLSE